MYKVLADIDNIQSYNDDIIFLYEILDRELNNILDKISSSIYNFQSAVKAKDFYDKDWFINQLLSVDAKVKIALLLKKTCEKYKVQSNTWEAIVLNSVAILSQIDILQNKEIFRKSLGE